MGSTKHIRNNGEHLNIHGHDNYQMPGAYKQMGDKNQNQSLGAVKELKGDQKDELPIELQEAIIKSDQPGKISGGAAAYIRGAYGADKIGDPKNKLDGVTLVGNDKTDPDSRKQIIEEGVKTKEQRLANQMTGVKELRKQKTRDSLSMDMDSPSRAKKAFDFGIYGNTNSPNSGGVVETNHSIFTSKASDATVDKSIKARGGSTELGTQVKKFKNLLGKNANTGANKKYKH